MSLKIGGQIVQISFSTYRDGYLMLGEWFMKCVVIAMRQNLQEMPNGLM